MCGYCKSCIALVEFLFSLSWAYKKNYLISQQFYLNETIFKYEDKSRPSDNSNLLKQKKWS
jgi:hypothetical protein